MHVRGETILNLFSLPQIIRVMYQKANRTKRGIETKIQGQILANCIVGN